MARERIEWIDVAKGIGILLVVATHVFSKPVSTYSGWFFMPLFFFLSGFLYRGPVPSGAFIAKRAKHLLIPYVAFLLVLGAIVYGCYWFLDPQPDRSAGHLLEYIGRFFYSGCAVGGKFGYLGRSFGAPWFVVCLFLVQVVYNELFKRTRGNSVVIGTVMLVAYGVAAMDGHYKWNALVPTWGLPWNVNVAALGLVYFWLGNVFACVGASPAYVARGNLYDTLAFCGSAAFVFVAVTLEIAGHPNLGMYDMKTSRYGLPGYDFILAMSCICLTLQLSRVIASNRDIVRTVLVECGQASMVILFVHSFIQFTMRDYASTNNKWLRMIAATLLSYVVYRLILLSKPARRLFLGEVPSGKKIEEPRQTAQPAGTV